MPRKPLSDQEINTAKIRDQNKKTDRENVYNSCRLTRDFFFFRLVIAFMLETTDGVSNIDSYFLPESCYVIGILANENTLLMKNTVSGLSLQRHPNDIKLFNSSHYPPYLGRPSKMIILHMTKIYTGEIFLILLPKVSTSIKANPLKRGILAKFY